MNGTPIVCGNVSAVLRSAPINPDWILDGDPVARNGVLSRSADAAAFTLVWDCTPGRFKWRYDIDETIHILEGRVVLDDGVTGARHLGPGDVVFFPAGAVVEWTVEVHVRKLAFFRRQLPKPIAIMAQAVRRSKALLRNRTRASGGTGELPILADAPSTVQRAEA